MTGTWATGWATGDIVTAAEFKKGGGSISDTTLGSSAASVDIASIVATYAHLLIAVYARGDTAATSVATSVRFNNDTAANYDSQYVRGNGAAASAAEAFGATGANICITPANTAGANLFGACLLFVPHYAGTSNNKEITSLSACKIGTAGSNQFTDFFGGAWRSSAAINRVTIFPTAGNFVTGTRVTIYGLGA
jgi:hypothetical protein